MMWSPVKRRKRKMRRSGTWELKGGGGIVIGDGNGAFLFFDFQL